MQDDPFGLVSPAILEDPYAIYARMRQEAPVYRCEAWDGWVLTRYADVAAAFRDRRLSSARVEALVQRLAPDAREAMRPLTRNLSSWALLVDPPVHSRLRALLSKAFLPRFVERLRPAIATLASTLIDDAVRDAAGGPVDVVTALANPLPVFVIGDLLGLPRADGHLLKKWSDCLATFFGAGRLIPEIVVAACTAVVELEAYFRDALAVRRSTPRDDLLTSLLGAETDGKLLSEGELLAMCALILFGGHETTTNLIANGLHTLLAHPSELARLRVRLEATTEAVEEIFRYESPIHRISRVASVDLEIGGVQIRAAERVFLVVAAAHRDPTVFPEPDRFDVFRSEREEGRHLGLGLGSHFCVGAALGRMEAELALSTLLRRATKLELVRPRPLWHDNLAIRSLKSLPVTGFGEGPN
jgi:cytochrome P450